MESNPVLGRGQYTILMPGRRYAIAGRPTITATVAAILDSNIDNLPVVLTVKLTMPALASWDEDRHVHVARLIRRDEDHLEFEALIPNGPRLLRATVSFYGTTDGFVELFAE